MREPKLSEKYKPETTQIDRAELLLHVKKVAYGPGLELLRAVLRDLDQAEGLLQCHTCTITATT